MQLLLFVIFVKIALGEAIIRINNASEFINFVSDVNSGTNYNGATVLLGSDLSFSGKSLEPIGNDGFNYFRGTFDGQGHIISILKVNIFSSFYAGLFGYSGGLTIRNIVLDSSCSITNSFSGAGSVGGIIGECRGYSGQCNIENSVNMADVTFSGISRGYSLYLGSIAGRLYSYDYSIYVKNCANYGSVTLTGTSSYSCIGGIVGWFDGSGYKYLYNCLNYGAITHSGTASSSLHLGGIVGKSYESFIENCVSAGETITQNTPSDSSIGSIAGWVYSNTHTTNCYFTSDAGVNNLYGTGTPTSTTETTNSTSTVNSTLITKLNDYATNKSWNKWLFNENNASVSFIINYEKSFTASSQIILLPDPANNSELNFSGWYADANLNTLFNLSRMNADTTLYGMFCGSSKYTMTLDANGGNELGENENEMIVGCMSYYGPLPGNVTRAEYTFTGWFTERGGGDKVESGDKVKTLNNHTLYAHWVINNYTVIFDFDNGTTVNKTFIYNTSVKYPKKDDMKKEGYIFSGWDKSDIVNMPAQNITITALWIANNYTVTLDANEGNVSDTSMTVTFNSSYDTLPEAEKPGYMFLGWFTEKANGTKVSNKTIVTVPNNHTLYAQWEKITNQVEIVFSTKDLSREDVEEFVRKYVDENTKFTITVFEEESGEIRVIIKFANNEEATMFVRNVNELSRDDDSNMIKRIGFVPDSDASFSLILYPTLFIIPLL